jgi:hypothetical protein
MPGPIFTGQEFGNISVMMALYASLTPAASVTNASSTTSTYTINGLQPNDAIDIYPQAALTTALTIGAIWVSAANTLSVQWVNSTAGTSTGSPAAISFIIIVNRVNLSPYPLGSSYWPTALE